MRILPQDGFYDLPYDSVWLRFEENDGCTIYAIPISSVVDDLTCDCELPIMGEYSSEAKARKAMEMLREEYAGIPNIRRMDDLYGRFKHVGKKDFELFIEHMVLKKDYFQFPADDKVEV